ncbi:MAG TPA: Uma2 family endonuclease [Terriglobia bacterium]|nr:Uma2 family endonuclease [Terriglobia bacterium]
MQLTIPIPECQVAVRFPAGILKWSEEEFFHFCQANRDLRIERSPKGEILVMSPAEGYASFQNLKVASQLDMWATKDGSGVAFDSSAGFRLPNGAMRSPDAAWVQLSRLKNLSRREKEQFIPLCPNFVIEVASPSDEISDLRAKMREYVECGLRLGWVILPASTQAEVYTSAGMEMLNSPVNMSADPVLPGFKLELASIWIPPF